MENNRSHECVKKHDFWANFKRNIQTILFVNYTFFRLQTSK